jgi:pyruvate dehydrogenase E2 component (dihydrolipoamide acetyltransferase)
MELKLPKLSATMEEARIVEWLKREGDSVREGEVLYLLETDKTTIEVESTATGVLRKILADTDRPLAPGTPVCVIDTGDEEPRPADGGASSEAGASPAAGPAPADSGVSAAGAPPSEVGGEERIRISPAARKLAMQLGVDITKVTGTGPQGRIGLKDIEEAAKRRQSAQAEELKQAEEPKQPELPAANPERENAATEPMSPMRAAIARNMEKSWSTIPAFWLERWVNAENMLKAREVLRKSRDEALHGITVTDFLLQAIGFALQDMPDLNVRLAGPGRIERIGAANVGLAISLEEGLVAPVLANMNRTLAEISRARQEAVQAARQNQMMAKQPASITLSNLGAAGIDRFRAIVKPDEAMILAVGAIQERVVAENGHVVVRSGLSLVLTVDHRIIDGMKAAQFLSAICETIENGLWKIT